MTAPHRDDEVTSPSHDGAFLVSDVLSRDMCIGCGACSVATDGAIPVTFTSIGLWQASAADATARDLAAADQVCPFSDAAKNEDALSYPERGAASELPHDPVLGHFSMVLAGRRTDDQALESSSSGGMTSWLLEQLLAEGYVDGVLHVSSSSETSRLVDFTTASHTEDIRRARKSQYHSVTLAEVVPLIRGDGKRYALVGVPCFIRAARLLADQDPVLRDQLAFYVGLVCGHMKTASFAESFAWQLGVPPEDIESVDFRKKNPARQASEYDFEVTTRSGDERSAKSLDLVGSTWGHGAFQPEACNFCDDIFAETADVVLGDAWLPEYAGDWRGTNVVVSRNTVIDGLLRAGTDSGELDVAALPTERAVRSQGGNFRHRRDGLRVRLADDLSEGLKVPAKRVRPGYENISESRHRLLRLRRTMSRVSIEAFERAKLANDLDAYLTPMNKLIESYEAESRPTGLLLLKGKVGHRIAPLRARIRSLRTTVMLWWRRRR